MLSSEAGAFGKEAAAMPTRMSEDRAKKTLILMAGIPT
jgi:hypothetical protein